MKGANILKVDYIYQSGFRWLSKQASIEELRDVLTTIVSGIRSGLLSLRLSSIDLPRS